MFQSIKRAIFLSGNNFSHEVEGDLVHLHLYLQKSGWPANQFVDLFVRCHTKWDPTFDELSFEMFMRDQYDWVRRNDVEALKRILQRIDNPQYDGVDNDGLVKWLHQLVEGVKERHQPAPTARAILGRTV